MRALRSIGDKLTILVCDQPVAAPPSPTPAPGVTGKKVGVGDKIIEEVRGCFRKYLRGQRLVTKLLKSVEVGDKIIEEDRSC